MLLAFEVGWSEVQISVIAQDLPADTVSLANLQEAIHNTPTASMLYIEVLVGRRRCLGSIIIFHLLHPKSGVIQISF
jgi:hypothetical protein